MDSEKFRDLLMKINNVKLQKPSEIARTNSLQIQAEQLRIRCNDLMQKTQKLMIVSQDLGNKKTSELMDIETKSRQKWYSFQKKIAIQKQQNQTIIKTSMRIAQQLQEVLNKKTKALHSQLRQRNQAYLRMLNNQLQGVKTLRNVALQRKNMISRNYQIYLADCMKKADKILQSQQKDMEIINQLQIEMMARCDQIQNQYELKLEEEKQCSNHRQKMLFRKLETLIGDIDID